VLLLDMDGATGSPLNSQWEVEQMSRTYLGFSITTMVMTMFVSPVRMTGRTSFLSLFGMSHSNGRTYCSLFCTFHFRPNSATAEFGFNLSAIAEFGFRDSAVAEFDRPNFCWASGWRDRR
jgi:hypothetical protein